MTQNSFWCTYPGKDDVHLLQKNRICSPPLNRPEQNEEQSALACSSKLTQGCNGELLIRIPTSLTYINFRAIGIRTTYPIEPHMEAFRKVKSLVGDGALQDTRFSMKKCHCGWMG